MLTLEAMETPELMIENPVSPLQVILVSADFAVGEPRISFAIFDGTEVAADVASVHIKAFELGEDMTPTNPNPVWKGRAAGYTDYEIPYWVVYPQLPTAGYWGLGAEIKLANGSTARSDFVVEVLPKNQGPAIGDTPPASENRTLATVPDIALLTSATDPDPAFYQMTVAEALTSGKPSVVGFLTPAFCQTQWCAPVLDSLEAVRAETGEDANFIHVEVYDDFQKLTPVKEMAEWGLETEPWVFVLDADGRVTARFSGPLSPRELTAALWRLTGNGEG
jgi:hypothetical protein